MPSSDAVRPTAHPAVSGCCDREQGEERVRIQVGSRVERSLNPVLSLVLSKFRNLCKLPFTYLKNEGNRATSQGALRGPPTPQHQLREGRLGCSGAFPPGDGPGGRLTFLVRRTRPLRTAADQSPLPQSLGIEPRTPLLFIKTVLNIF